jgi:predicted nucleic acid-binding protein
MTRLVTDASAIAAIAFGEPEGEALAAKLEGATLFAPTLLTFELTNTALKKMRKRPDQAAAILKALEDALSDDRGINWRAVEPLDVALVAQTLGCSAYDAAYVWLAGMLGAELVTLDRRLAAVTAIATA